MLTFLATAYFVSVAVTGQVTLPPGTKPLNKDNAVYHDCGQLQRAGHRESGPYLLHMYKTPFLIRCEFTEGNALTVIQRRVNGLVHFNKTLEEYKKGFGDATGDYWAGLNVMNYLTMGQGNSKLTINLTDWDNVHRHANYSIFTVQSAADNYMLIVKGFNGTVGYDAFGFQNEMNFQTGEDTVCSEGLNIGWWYNKAAYACTYALLNGHYYRGGYYPSVGRYPNGIFWRQWGNKSETFYYSLKHVSMAVSSF